MINKIVFLIILTLTMPAALCSNTTDKLPATLRYSLDLKLDYRNEKIMGKCEITILNDTDHPVNQIPILLYRLLTVESVKGENGSPLSFTQDIVNTTGWEKLQVNYIRITDDIAPGQRWLHTVRI